MIAAAWILLVGITTALAGPFGGGLFGGGGGGGRATTTARGGVQLGLDVPYCLRLSADTPSTGENDTTIADLTFTPEPLTTYIVTFDGVFDADAATTGLYYYVSHGDATEGGVAGRTRGSSATAQAVLEGSQSTTFVQGASSGATLTGFQWRSWFTTDADPTAVGPVYRAETGSTGSVVIKAGLTTLCYRRSVP